MADDPDRDLALAALEEYPRGTRWFTEIVTIHWDCVWSLCQAALLEERAAESTTQLAFLRVHRRLGRYQFQQPLGAWMCAIARRAVEDTLTERGRTTDSDGGGVERIGSWIARRSGQGLSPSRAFAELALADRQLLALQCVDGLSERDVAAAVGIEPAALGGRLEAARAALGARLPAARAKPGHGAPEPVARGAGALDPREAAAVRAALGEPDRERIVRAIDEIEHQVALEDVVAMLFRSVAEAAQEFFEVMGQVYAPGAPPPAQPRERK